MDLDLDFDHLYSKQYKPRYESKSVAKNMVKKKKKRVKRRKKKATIKQWDGSLSNLKQHKLPPSKQLEKKLNAVSKHRHYAKDLVQEQKRRHLEERRLKQEEKEAEDEQKQLIRRKQLLLRKHAVPNVKRAFPIFTAGRSNYDDSDSEDIQETLSDLYKSDSNDEPNTNELTLKVLSSKLSSLENELETMKLMSKNSDIEINEEHKLDGINDITLNMDSINKTLNAAKQKKSSKTLDIKLPEMPNISNINMNTDTSQLNKEQIVTMPKSVSINNEEKKVNAALNSLDVSSLTMLLDKLKIYFKDIQNEKKQNEEFRSTLLESVNAQNTQILHLLAQLASQQKEIDTLKNTVTNLNDKLEKVEKNSNVYVNNSEPKWNQFIPNNNGINNNEIQLEDIKNVIEESRANKYKKQIILKNTDWKSISNVLLPKNDCNQYASISQQPFSVQKHQRSFLPPRKSIESSKEQMQRINPPQPFPKQIKPIGNIENTNHYVQIDSSQMQNIQCNYPTVRVERFNK